MNSNFFFFPVSLYVYLAESSCNAPRTDAQVLSITLHTFASVDTRMSRTICKNQKLEVMAQFYINYTQFLDR